MNEACVFCGVAAGAIDADVVHADDRVVAFRDIAPKAPVHVLIIPRDHIASVDHLTDADAATVGNMVEVARDVARAEGLTDDGYRLVINTGPAAGQTVPHLHIHLLGGRELGWPPG
ncbi:MAG TPA: histidine triad nucleotide-binding protein [Longimicrobiales bacterium]|nr:histidine triad nucleotide-binding protein [Longimicrobiales bacterium]